MGKIVLKLKGLRKNFLIWGIFSVIAGSWGTKHYSKKEVDILENSCIAQTLIAKQKSKELMDSIAFYDKDRQIQDIINMGNETPEDLKRCQEISQIYDESQLYEKEYQRLLESPELKKDLRNLAYYQAWQQGGKTAVTLGGLSLLLGCSKKMTIYTLGSKSHYL